MVDLRVSITILYMFDQRVSTITSDVFDLRVSSIISFHMNDYCCEVAPHAGLGGVGASLRSFCQFFSIDLPDDDFEILAPPWWPCEDGLEHILPDGCVCLVRMAISDSLDSYNLEWCLPDRTIKIPTEFDIFLRCKDYYGYISCLIMHTRLSHKPTTRLIITTHYPYV